jgi:hypothetical protein
MKHLRQYREYEFHVAEEKSTNELIDEFVEALEKEESPQKKWSFTDAELEAFCRRVILQLLNKAIEEHGLTSLKELIEEIQEPDNAGDEWKDQ